MHVDGPTGGSQRQVRQTKALSEGESSKEEVKRLRNEKRDTGRSTAEVELHRSLKRQISESQLVGRHLTTKHTTLCTNSRRLLGQEVETDDGLRVARQVGSARARWIRFPWPDMSGCRAITWCRY